DPLLIYQKEAFEEFERMQQAIQDDIVRNIFRGEVVMEQAQPDLPIIAPAIPLPQNLPRYSKPQDLDTPTILSTGPTNPAVPARKDGAPPGWKGGRNDPCWCGSGQKYKKCHGK
ncbi:MAG TPA: SEC-C metal-binding domain-containing protein, partial [Chthonomonadales bacterium]|nr:SEC-C metal-binding domain-containing protein [Chthonomonadales bacterium]